MSVSSAILSKAGCAKASLYGNFDSKVDLATAFPTSGNRVDARLARNGDPQAGIGTGRQAAGDIRCIRRLVPEALVRGMLLHQRPAGIPSWESGAPRGRDPSFQDTGHHQSVSAREKLRDPERFAQAWHMLMKGSIVSACEGNRNAARDAKRAAGLILDGWKQISSPCCRHDPRRIIRRPSEERRCIVMAVSLRFSLQERPRRASIC